MAMMKYSNAVAPKKVNKNSWGQVKMASLKHDAAENIIDDTLEEEKSEKED